MVTLETATLETVTSERVTLAGVQAMKAAGRPIACVVAWDVQAARIADRAGVEIVSVGDTVGVHLWGRDSPLDVTVGEMVLVCGAVRRGVRRALVSCDLPYGPVQEGAASAVRAAVRLVKKGGADLVKLDDAGDHPDVVAAVVHAGIPVFAQFGITPQTFARHGVTYTGAATGAVPESLADEFVAQARRLEGAGASLLNFTNSGPVVGPMVARAVSVPVLGGHGGGPWLDGRIRQFTAATGYLASHVDLDLAADAYANTARISHDALVAYVGDVRAGRQIRGGLPD